MKSVAPKKSQIISWGISIVLMLVLFEILSSLVLIYTYGLNKENLMGVQFQESRFSSVNLINIIAVRVGLPSVNAGTVYNKKTDPDPFIISDPVMGYSAAEGKYIHTFLRKRSPLKEWESFKTEVTINKDGSRWTGGIEGEGLPRIYVLGDSFVFGTGVNNEQTFSFLLQNAMPDYEVKLFAFGGYSLTQAYLRLDSINKSITSSDIIILGYADFYDRRHAMSPRHVRAINNWTKRKNPDLMNKSTPLLKASLDKNGKIQHSYVNRNCSENNGYCDKDDPDSSDMTRLTAALVNQMAENTKAKVYLIHFAGKSDNPVFGLIHNKVTIISALSKDFDYFIRDDVEGFDDHPGPYWHYAISRKLLENLSISQAISKD